MRRRGMFLFLFLNVIVTAGVAVGIISLLGGTGSEPTERLVTFEVVITATTDPFVTPNVIVITATPDPNEPQRAVIPSDVREGTVTAFGAPTVTVDPSLLNEEGIFSGSVDQLPPGCIIHVLQENEFPSTLGETYGVSYFDILAVNGLTEDDATFLQIGQELIIPQEGCPIELFIGTTPTEEVATTDEVTEDGGEDNGDTSTNAGTEEPEGTEAVDVTPSITPTPTETPIPTITLAPTAENAQIEIVEIIGRGDITTEGVVIRNNGNTLDISGWTLSDADGNTYIFPDGRRLFSGASVTVNTRAGDNTPVLFFWGRDTAVFGEAESGGEVVVLADRDGQAQASIRLPALQNP